MPSHRILLLLRRPGELRLPALHRQVGALRRRAGVGEVLLGLHDPRGIRLLSPWLFLPEGLQPDGIGAPLSVEDASVAPEPREGTASAAIIRALLAHPLSIRDPRSLRAAFSGAVLADPSLWSGGERDAVAEHLPLLDPVDLTAASPARRVTGRIRQPGVGGPLRILALNLVEPAGQALLGRFVYELGQRRRLVELLDHREATAAAPLFTDELHVRRLDAATTDPSDEPWHLVLTGRDLPFSARPFSTLTARLFLCSRPSVLFREHRPVRADLDAGHLTFELTEQPGSDWLTLADVTADWSLFTLHNAQLFARDETPPGPPLAALLALATALEDGRSPLSALEAAERFRQRFGAPARQEDVMAGRLLAHRGYDPLHDPWIALSLAGEIGRLLRIERQESLRQAVFLRFLRRRPDSESDPEARPPLRKRIDIVRGVVRSGEYGRSAPPAVVAVTRQMVDLLHEAIFSGRGWDDAAHAPGETGPARPALVKACLAVVGAMLAEPRGD
jgi:hypothetical protein